MTNKIDLTIIIPLYNEANRIGNTLQALNEWRPSSVVKISQIIFVNDGSTDSTLKIVKNTHLQFPKKIISYPRNQGKGYAVRRGMLASTSAYTLLMDADLATPLSELDKLLPFMKKDIDVIIGTRKNGHSTVVVHQPLLRESMGKVFTKVTQLFLDVPITDFTCGFKAFSRTAKEAIFPIARVNRWSYDAEILFLASRLGFTIQEKAVIWSDQKGTKVSLLKDSLRSLFELLEIRALQFRGAYARKAPALGILKA